MVFAPSATVLTLLLVLWQSQVCPLVFWQLQQQDPRRTYRADCAILIEGRVEVDALRRALHDVVKRHRILRTGCRLLPDTCTAANAGSQVPGLTT